MLKGKPFVKWAGGKRQIIDKLKMYAPDEFNTYYEPFVGGGALLFELSPAHFTKGFPFSIIIYLQVVYILIIP